MEIIARNKVGDEVVLIWSNPTESYQRYDWTRSIDDPPRFCRFLEIIDAIRDAETVLED